MGARVDRKIFLSWKISGFWQRVKIWTILATLSPTPSNISIVKYCHGVSWELKFRCLMLPLSSVGQISGLDYISRDASQSLPWWGKPCPRQLHDCGLSHNKKFGLGAYPRKENGSMRHPSYNSHESPQWHCRIYLYNICFGVGAICFLTKANISHRNQTHFMKIFL